MTNSVGIEVGTVINCLTVVGEPYKQLCGSQWQIYQMVRCKCGNEKGIPTRFLRSGKRQTCGCNILSRTGQVKIGDVFGSLTVVGEQFLDSIPGSPCKGMYREFQCTCGNKKVYLVGQVIRGDVKACGCLQYSIAKTRVLTHGESKTKLYTAWADMKNRCTNTKYKRWQDYGGRGITVCQEWLDSYEEFSDWSKTNGFADHLTIDRIDNNRGYEPSNCRWTTMKVQGSNRRPRQKKMREDQTQ